MDRRDFIKKVGGTAVVLTVVPGAIIASRASIGMARPLPISKVMKLVSRETVSNVERSVIQSQWVSGWQGLTTSNHLGSLVAVMDKYKEKNLTGFLNEL